MSPQRSAVSSSSQGLLREAEGIPWREPQTPGSGLRTAAPVGLPPGPEGSAAVHHGAGPLTPLTVPTAPHHARAQQMPFPPVTLKLRDSKAVLSASAPPRAPAQALLLTHLALRVESLQSRPLH